MAISWKADPQLMIGLCHCDKQETQLWFSICEDTYALGATDFS
jgi:hypothetical protein